MLALLLPLSFALQQDPLAAVRAAEQQRIETIARVAPAVCAVMPMAGAGGGSGVLFDPAGFVLTNFHVVQRGRPKRGEKDDGDPAQKTMKVGLPDGTLQVADVLGIDPGSDLAVMLLRPRGDGSGFPAAPLGDSGRLLVGEGVFAMGNPFLLATDFVPTVTWGIVSGTHRYQGGGQNRFLVYPDCIQVDAPVNPGNSGGPLFDLNGRIVGINGRISVRDRGRVNTGVGFAIASDQIRNFLGDLLAGRHAEHGTLDLNAWYMTAPGGERRGVFVQSLFTDSIAGRLGVGLGDELTKFNGTEIRSANQLATLVGVLPAGTWVTLAFRPRGDDGFGDEREITFALPRLDTGSSRNPDRLATEAVRLLAKQAMTRGIGAGEAAPDGVELELHEASVTTVWRAAGDAICAERDRKRFVLAGDEAFVVEPDGSARDATDGERAWLQRERAANPWLRRGPSRAAQLEAAVLAGGVMAFSRPGCRFDLPGDGELQVLLGHDAAPLGYRLRDPLQRVLVERVRDGERLRISTDGVLAPPGRIVGPRFGPQPDGAFARPGR
jgi:S1-C subfamily serine protease